jgi:hypothetical protein
MQEFFLRLKPNSPLVSSRATHAQTKQINKFAVVRVCYLESEYCIQRQLKHIPASANETLKTETIHKVICK